jgi:hypothetical protein
MEGRVVKPDCKHGPEMGERVVRHRCPKALPSSQQITDSVVGVEVAGAYVRKAACRLAENDFSPLNVGGRKSREA